MRERKDAGFLLAHDISIWVDEYDDIFSDFDSRSYPERNISDDFLYELKRISQENAGFVRTLKLLVPEKIRDQKVEEIIIKRLHAHFRKHYDALYGNTKSGRRRGWFLIFIAACVMNGAGYISSIKANNFLLHFAVVILEPAGWFWMWRGFDHLVNASRKRLPDLEFYTKMNKSKPVFVSIENKSGPVL